MEAGGRKRAPPAVANGTAAKRSKERDGVGSKLKPCTKFFSTAGCPFGEGCHFLHFVPGGYPAAVSKMNLSTQSVTPSGRALMDPSPNHDGHAAPTLKTRLCNKYNTAEGCKFGDRCHFAHGAKELGMPVLGSQEGNVRPSIGGVFGGAPEPPAAPGAPASFGTSATARISVDASLAGAIIGKGGANTKQISRVSGVKLSIREHESDASLKNIELEGTFDQIQQASAMVSELIGNISGTVHVPARNPASAQHTAPGGTFFKTKLCEKFAKGSCTFGDRCHFAHGAGELRKMAA